jgi:hypothetical protein
LVVNALRATGVEVERRAVRALILMARKEGDGPIDNPLHALEEGVMEVKLADIVGTWLL